METDPIARFFDREAAPCCQGDPDDGVAGVSSVLLKHVERLGIDGRTVLELGCGTGGLSLEALRRGASAVTGIDLSPVSVQVARRRAARSGLGERARFEVGDGAEGAPPHDVVVLDKVICCYPVARRLLSASSEAARGGVVFSVPASRGLRGLAARVERFFENLWRAARRDPFRAYVHDLRGIDEGLRAQGLRRVSQAFSWTWYVAAYARGS
ncbi:MAG: methyltransferase domain-containing protein [Actinomycetota bacterium]